MKKKKELAAQNERLIAHAAELRDLATQQANRLSTLHTEVASLKASLATFAGLALEKEEALAGIALILAPRFADQTPIHPGKEN